MLTFTERLQQDGPILLDAAVGTALLERRLKLAGDDAISWSRTHPNELMQLHRAHREAGATLLLANTFGSRTPTAQELMTAVALAKESGAPFVAVSLWPGLADRALREAAKIAAQSGADLLWLETSMHFSDCERALLAVKKECDLPVAVMLALGAFPPRPSSLKGFIEEARGGFSQLAESGAALVGLNCGPWDVADGISMPVTAPGCAILSPDPGGAPLQPIPIDAVVAALAPTLPIPFAIKPDAGFRSPEDWAAMVGRAIRAGAKLAGGCCGTDARHLRALNSVVHFRCG